MEGSGIFLGASKLMGAPDRSRGELKDSESPPKTIALSCLVIGFWIASSSAVDIETPESTDQTGST